MTSPAAADLRFATVSWLHPTTGECHTATLTDGHLDDATERAVAALPAAVQPHYRQFLAWKSGAAALHPRANLSDRTAQAHAAFQAWKACPHRGNHLAPLNDPPTTCTCTDARVLLEFCDLKDLQLIQRISFPDAEVALRHFGPGHWLLRRSTGLTASLKIPNACLFTVSHFAATDAAPELRHYRIIEIMGFGYALLHPRVKPRMLESLYSVDDAMYYFLAYAPSLVDICSMVLRSTQHAHLTAATLLGSEETNALIMSSGYLDAYVPPAAVSQSSGGGYGVGIPAPAPVPAAPVPAPALAAAPAAPAVALPDPQAAPAPKPEAEAADVASGKEEEKGTATLSAPRAESPASPAVTATTTSSAAIPQWLWVVVGVLLALAVQIALQALAA